MVTASRLPAAPDLVIGGRFRLTDCLKRGELAETWQVVDLRDGSPAVAKLVAAEGISSARRLRLAHEAAVLSRLELPAKPLATGTADGLVYLVQTYVEGSTLQERLWRGPLPVEATVRIGIDVLRVLQSAHEQDVVHRDVKPANVIVRGEPPQGAALIDFGLAQSAWLDRSLREELVGTVQYLAPEAAGLVDAEVDERSDLYSTGVVLYECVAGHPPFEGPTVGEVLRAHAGRDAAPLRSVRHGVPRALEEVILRLLTKDPAERYQSAAAAAADLVAIADALARGVADPPVTIGVNDRRRSLAQAAFVGREAELAALAHAVGGDGRLVLVEGESGVGKSRLLDELCLRLGPAVRVVRGQGVDQAALRPLQVLDGVVDGLSLACAADQSLVARLALRLGPWTAAAAAAVPALGAVLGVEAGESPEVYGQTRTVAALAALFDALGSIDRHVVVVLDDVQWADAMTLRLLAECAQPEPRGEPAGFTVVAAFRSEEVGERHPLRSLPAPAHVVLGPFGDDDVSALCESMAGPLPAEATAAVARLAEGNPFMASAVLWGLVESGVLNHGGDGWHLDMQALAGAQTSRRAGLFLVRRLERLPAPALRLLTAGAVLGKAFDLDTALRVAALDVAAAAGALQESRQRHIVWVDERQGRCTFAHDKLREALLERIDPDERAEWHRRAAAAIGATAEAPAFELAYHYDAAGMAEAAFPYALEAAVAARARHALDASIAQYRIAERGATTRATEERRVVLEGLGEVLSLAGEYLEAERYLEEALTLAQDATERSSLEGRLGEVAFRRGDQVAARRYVEGALRQAGRWVPRSLPGFVLGTLWEVAVQAWHTVAPRRRRRCPGNAATNLLAVRLYSRLAYIFWFSRGRFPCAWAHLRAMNAAERYPPTPELGQAWSIHAPVVTMVPWFTRGLAYAEKSYGVRVALGDRWGQGQSLSFRGVVLYAASRWHEGIATCRQAVELLATTGDRWEENTAWWHVALCHYRLGQLEEAVDVARAVHARAAAIGDQTARGIALGVWARAAPADVPAELLAAELALDTTDAHTAVEVRVGEAVRRLAAGDVAGALGLLDEALSLIRTVGLRQEYVMPAYVWAATARRMAVEEMPVPAWRRRRAALRAARRTGRQALRKARRYRNNLPHALREAALVAALGGRGRRAARLLARSAAVAERQGAAHEQRLTEQAAHGLVMAVTPARLPADPAGPATAPAPAELVDEDRAWSLSLADRFSTLLEVGRLISSASSPAAVYDAVREGALQLLRGEHCHVVALPPGGELNAVGTTASGNPIDDVSHELLAEALHAGRPVVADAELADDPSESLVLSGARSAIAAPISCEGRPVACLYVVSRHMSQLFGEQEIQLTSFIATLAGAALDHVAGSEARFRSLVQKASDVITVLDGDGRITYQSDSVLRVFGLDPGAMTGRLFAEWVHPDDVVAFAAALDDRRARTWAGTTLHKCRVSDAGGSWRHVETAMTDLLTDPGVRGIVLNIRDVTERVALESQLRHRAWHDVLTGLANRTLFLDRVEHARARYARKLVSFAVIFVDLDDFKSVNDTLGHPTGDRFLQTVAARLAACVRPEDTVARFGGDEFAILLEGADPDRVRVVCERLLQTLAAPVDLLGHQLETHASLGVVMGDGAADPEQLLAAADTALYVAKARGKRRYEIFEPSMRTAAVARAELRSHLHHALSRSELHLAYQPVVTITTGEVTGLEALLRWTRPQRGVLSPDEFVGLAEESGEIVPIGAWVLASACRQAKSWNEIASRPLTMAVNVSARQLLHPGLVDEVQAALADAGIDPRLLVLEITESATVQETEVVAGKLAALKALGVQLAVDDFGTGYSALGYLRHLPVDMLKIDRSFVAGLGRNPEDAAIVETVITLADAFQLQTVAEGVERADQLEVLAALGCQHAQGFYWQHPLPADELTAWMLDTAGYADR